MAGAAVSIVHGIQLLFSPEPAADFAVAYVVSGCGVSARGTSFARVLRQVHAEARKQHRTVLDQVLNSSDPTMRAVVAEDGAVLADIVLAFAGILTHPLSGSAMPDAVGSIAARLLLGDIAVVIIQKNGRFLVNQAVTAEHWQSVAQPLMDGTEMARITYLPQECIGPRQLNLVAAVDLGGDRIESEVAVRCTPSSGALKATRG